MSSSPSRLTSLQNGDGGGGEVILRRRRGIPKLREMGERLSDVTGSFLISSVAPLS